MNTFFCVLLLVAGLLAMAPLLITWWPESRAVLAKLTPWQGILGFVLLIVGGFWLIKYGFAFLRLFTAAPFASLLGIATIAVAILLGFLLSQPLLARVTGTMSAKARVEAFGARLRPHQVTVGIAAVCLAIYAMV